MSATNATLDIFALGTDYARRQLPDRAGHGRHRAGDQAGAARLQQRPRERHDLDHERHGRDPAAAGRQRRDDHRQGLGELRHLHHRRRFHGLVQHHGHRPDRDELGHRHRQRPGDPRQRRRRTPGRVRLANASVSFGDFLTLTGDFTIGISPTASSYGARNVEVFLGDGPYRLADKSVNPDAIGVVVTNGTLGAVKFADGTFAIYAYGQAALVGLDGLTISGNLLVRINNSGRAVTDTINLPDPAATIAMPS